MNVIRGGGSAYIILARKPQEKRPLGRPGRRRDVIIRIALTEILLEGVDCLNLAQGRDKRRALTNAVMKFYVIHTVFLQSIHRPTYALHGEPFMTCQLLHVSAPRCHLQGLDITKVYKLTRSS
jgi:hypothetical protein